MAKGVHEKPAAKGVEPMSEIAFGIILFAVIYFLFGPWKEYKKGDWK